MSVVERGQTPSNAIRKSVGGRTFGAETFNPRGTKIQGSTARKYVEQQKQGRPLGRLVGAPPSLGNAVLDLFHTKHTTPLYNDGLGDDDDFNIAYVVNRAVKAFAPHLDPIQADQLCILYKNNEFNLNTCRLEGADFTYQCNPLDIISPQVFNYILYQLQEEESRIDPEKYSKRTPQEYFNDFSIDGIAEAVAPMQNRASVFAGSCSGYDGTIIDNPTACTSLVTMIAKGVLNCVNYWGPNVEPGAELYIVFRKFELGDYSHDYFHGKQTLSNHAAKRQQTLAPSSDATANPFTPYQLAFFALPKGGIPPVEYTRYRDEAGNTRTDSIVIHVGRVTEVPIGHVFRDTTERLKPFTGALPNCPLSSYSMISDNMINKGHLMQYTIKIILNPDDYLV